jgi:hypothetical protein
MEQEDELGLGRSLWKYFEHGFLFSLIMIGLVIVWAAVLVVLVVTGFIIGLILGLVILLFILGWLNAGLTSWIWETPIRTDWKTLLAHGLVLLIALIVVDIPRIVVNYAVPSIITTVVMFVVYCFIDGFVAKNVGGYFEETSNQSAR